MAWVLPVRDGSNYHVLEELRRDGVGPTHLSATLKFSFMSHLMIFIVHLIPFQTFLISGKITVTMATAIIELHVYYVNY